MLPLPVVCVSCSVEVGSIAIVPVSGVCAVLWQCADCAVHDTTSASRWPRLWLRVLENVRAVRRRPQLHQSHRSRQPTRLSGGRWQRGRAKGRCSPVAFSSRSGRNVAVVSFAAAVVFVIASRESVLTTLDSCVDTASSTLARAAASGRCRDMARRSGRQL